MAFYLLIFVLNPGTSVTTYLSCNTAPVIMNFECLALCSDHFFIDFLYFTSEEVEEQAQVTSLLEAKRRGISRSALRSHQPVARPVTAGLSR